MSVARAGREVVEWGMRAQYLVLIAGCGRFGFGEAPAGDGMPDGPRDVCDATPGADSVALYTFEGGSVADATGAHPGIAEGTLGVVAGRCGATAIEFSSSYVRVPDSPAFDLEAGAIELFVRTSTPAAGTEQGILSRDANGTDFDGHLSIGLAKNGQLWVRLQRMLGNLSVFRCSEPLPADQWVHVGVSFGGADGFGLWIDHVRSTTTTAMVTNSMVDCTTPHPYGIAGNDNTLVLGVLDFTAVNSDPNPVVVEPFTGGQLDQIHIHSQPKDFGVP